jgi:hypothetical protein
MTVFRKLQAARYELVKSGIKKTGHNKFGGWHYYELGDFIPTVHRLFDAVGLCGVVTFGETATLTIYDTEDGSSVKFSTPIVYAEANKGQPIQMLGSTHTYLRRYLWLLAMEIVEADAIDSQEQEVKPVKIQKPASQEPKVEAPKPTPAPVAKASDDMKEWEIRITAVSEDKWADMVMDATKVALECVQSAADVQSIFKTNRATFDKLKAEHNPLYTELLEIFKQTKESFKE